MFISKSMENTIMPSNTVPKIIPAFIPPDRSPMSGTSLWMVDRRGKKSYFFTTTNKKRATLIPWHAGVRKGNVSRIINGTAINISLGDNHIFRPANVRNTKGAVRIL